MPPRVKLYFENENETWHSIPGWAEYLIDCGYCLAEGVAEGKVVLALSLPSTHFASAFTALGVVVNGLDNFTKSDSAHVFESLKNKDGTSVTYRRNENGELKTHSGILRGWGENNRGTYLIAQYHGSKKGKDFRHFIFESDWSSIEITDQPVTFGRSWKGKAITTNLKFLDEVLGNDLAKRMTELNHNVCTIVDDKSRFESILSLSCVGAVESETGRHPEEWHVGSLADLIRPNNVTDFQDSYLSLFINSNSRQFPQQNHKKVPIGIVCGSRAFLKFSKELESIVTLILLGRTDRKYSEAISELNAQFSARRDDFEPEFSRTRPKSIEILGFKN